MLPDPVGTGRQGWVFMKDSSRVHLRVAPAHCNLNTMSALAATQLVVGYLRHTAQHDVHGEKSNTRQAMLNARKWTRAVSVACGYPLRAPAGGGPGVLCALSSFLPCTAQAGFSSCWRLANVDSDNEPQLTRGNMHLR